MTQPIKIGDVLSRSWALYKSKFGLVFCATLVTLLLSCLACGILSGPLMCGLFILIDGIAKDPNGKHELGTVFKGFDFFGGGFVVWLVMTLLTYVASFIIGLVPFVGIVASILVGFVGGVLQMLALLFVARRGMKGMEAVGAALGAAFKGEYNNLIVGGVVFALVGGAGALVCGIGALFTLPLYIVAMSLAYDAAFGDAPAVEAPAPAEPAA